MRQTSGITKVIIRHANTVPCPNFPPSLPVANQNLLWMEESQRLEGNRFHTEFQGATTAWQETISSEMHPSSKPHYMSRAKEKEGKRQEEGIPQVPIRGPTRAGLGPFHALPMANLSTSRLASTNAASPSGASGLTGWLV